MGNRLLTFIVPLRLLRRKGLDILVVLEGNDSGYLGILLSDAIVECLKKLKLLTHGKYALLTAVDMETSCEETKALLHE